MGTLRLSVNYLEREINCNAYYYYNNVTVKINFFFFFLQVLIVIPSRLDDNSITHFQKSEQKFLKFINLEGACTKCASFLYWLHSCDKRLVIC
jgi:ABC-type amino acid transport system permease subunit